MVNTVQVNTYHVRDLHPIANHMTKLRHFIKGEIRELSSFLFSLQLIFDQSDKTHDSANFHSTALGISVVYEL